ncbi:MAG: hypothetical protein GQ574_17875 [Crocinitomix sp.]|nr:hypothetical protein [Crocinitomix sp.]
MIRITADAHQEKINILDKEIILNGPPNRLKGRIQFASKHTETVRIKSLGLADKKTKGVVNDVMRVSLRLNPGEQASKQIDHQLPINTPPGTYQKYITIGETTFPVKMIVQPLIDVRLSHSDFTFQGTAPGTIHTVQFMLENRGNMPFCIPTLKHAAMLDMDLMCRAFGTGFRETKVEGFEKTMDMVAENVKANMVDWVSIKLKEAGQTLESGASQLLTVLFTIPENADAKKDYDGEFRFWDQGISVAIKSHIDKK